MCWGCAKQGNMKNDLNMKIFSDVERDLCKWRCKEEIQIKVMLNTKEICTKKELILKHQVAQNVNLEKSKTPFVVIVNMCEM